MSNYRVQTEVSIPPQGGPPNCLISFKNFRVQQVASCQLVALQGEEHILHGNVGAGQVAAGGGLTPGHT